MNSPKVNAYPLLIIVILVIVVLCVLSVNIQ